MRPGQPFVTKPWIFVVLTFLFMRAAKELDPIAARLLALPLIIFWSWYFLQLGTALHATLSGEKEQTLRRFKFGVAYVFLFLSTIIWFRSNEFLLNNYSVPEYGWRWVVIPLGLIFLFVVVQNLYLVSRWMAACRKTQGHDEHWGVYMLLFWFFPIGIFIVQPRLVALLKHT